MGKEYNFRDFIKKYLFWILIFPILLISLIAFIVKWGTIIINTNELIIDIYSPIKLGDYLSYYISIVGIEVTGLLSYSIWNTSIKSYKLSEDINNKEENKDKERVRESALIIYYELLSNISILKMLYSTQVLKTKTKELNKISITSDWVKNIANLRDLLTRAELEMIFSLYNSLLLLNEMEYSSNTESDELKILVEKLSKKIFIPVLLDNLWMDFNGVIESTLNNKYYPVLRKIQLASKANQNNNQYNCNCGNSEPLIKQNNGNIKYKGEFINGIMQNGIDAWHFNNDNLLYCFNYVNGRIIRGKYINRFREDYELIFDCEFNEEGKQTSGYTTIFYSPNIIKYQGYITNGEYDGEGKFYSSNNSLIPVFSGIWQNGKMLNGEYINKPSNKIVYFKGDYHNNKPYSGKIECSELFEFKGAYGYKGKIHKGKLIDGSGYKFSKDIIDEEYMKENPYCDLQQDESPDYNEPNDEEVPYEVQQEWYQNSIRNEKQMDLDNYKEKYGHVVELIMAEWNNGECETYEDDIINKRYFAYANSQKKKLE